MVRVHLAPQNMLIKFFLIKNDDRLRIDVFLKKQFPELSRNWLQEMIKQGSVSVNDHKTESRYILKRGDKIKIAVQEKKQVKISQDSSVKLWIAFENKDFLVLHKQAGILVHPDRNPNIKTIVGGLLVHCPELKNVGEHPLRPGLVHRLDKETSGLLLVAKNQNSFLELKSLFKERQVKKTYKALVFGHFREKEGKIESYLSRSHKKPNARVSLVKPRGDLKARKAITYYRVEKKLIDRDNIPYTLLSLFPETGRTHQLRAQLFSMNYPIVGDPLYTTKKLPVVKIKRMFLHAEKLAFKFKNEYYQFYSPLPVSLTSFLNNLKHDKFSK